MLGRPGQFQEFAVVGNGVVPFDSSGNCGGSVRVIKFGSWIIPMPQNHA